LRQTIEAELAKAEVSATEHRAQIVSLNQQIAAYRQSLSGLQDATADDDQLLRKIKETEDNFFLYSKKREEARIEEVMDRQKIANVALVEQPRLPDLPKPKVSVTVVSTYVLGCLLIVGFALAIGVTRPSVYTAWELEGLTGLPVLASVPRQHMSPASEAFLLNSIPELKHE
jgi:polysaccharide biosynthesis protein PslE